jgi:DNA (cytosine-5)-methyltransferase 1
VPRPIAIELFSGAGGLSLGFEQAGFDVVAAVEIDPIHCAVHEFNFPRCTVFPQSVADLTGGEIRSRSGIGRRRVDVVFGGPPCQGFSLIGHRAMDDPRNSLVREFVRIVEELQPSYFVFENVKGLTVGSHRSFLEELIGTFGDCGYKVQMPWQVLDAASFGVPQHRERLILMGARRGIRLPIYPAATCYPADRTKVAGLTKGPTCRDAIDDLPNAEQFAELNLSDEVTARKWGRPSKYAEQMRCARQHPWNYGYDREWDRRLLTSSLRTEHTAISRRRFESTAHGQVEPISRFYKLSPDGLCNTLRAGTDSARGAFTSPRPIHYAFPRCITVREMARLHGFPDWFRFHVTKWHGARQIGNAVPPPLGRAVASKIIEALGAVAEHPVNRIALGNPRLLTMDMSEASAYFGISVPIARRDRKSGQKKRKQCEIEAEFESLLPFESGIALTI